MSTPAEATRVRHEVVVEAAIERAFSLFTSDFGAFKPREHNMLGVDIAETIFEPHVGGRLYDRGVDGSECGWARVLAYEPPDRVVISWDISPQWQIETDPDKTSEVEVRFIAEHPSARASCSSTATSTATSRAGKPSVRASTPRVAGRSTSSAMPTCWRPEGAFDGKRTERDLMAPIEVSIDVARPHDEAFAYVTDPSRFAEWQAGVVGGHMDGEATSVGSKCMTTRRIGGAEREVTSQVTKLDPPRAWGVRGIDGPIRAIVNVTVESLNASPRSRVTIALDFDGRGIGKLLVPLVVRRQARREMPANIQRLKERLEAAAH